MSQVRATRQSKGPLLLALEAREDSKFRCCWLDKQFGTTFPTILLIILSRNNGMIYFYTTCTAAQDFVHQQCYLTILNLHRFHDPLMCLLMCQGMGLRLLASPLLHEPLTKHLGVLGRS